MNPIMRSEYELTCVLKWKDQDAQRKWLKRTEPFVTAEEKALIGSFEGSPYQHLDVVRFKGDEVNFPFIIQKDSLVVIHKCLRYQIENDFMYVVQDADGVEVIVTSEEIEPV